MFAGIVEDKARVVSCSLGDSPRLVVESSLDLSATEIGDSIAIDGVCLTLVARQGSKLSFDVSKETLRRSTLALLKAGDAVNLERSLLVGGRVHGHFVFGHVDQVSILLDRSQEGSSYRFCWSLTDNLKPFFAEKCSVAVSGVSLTVGEVRHDHFTVYLVPHTLQVTTLFDMTVGQKANLEVDMLARYVHSMLSHGMASQTGSAVTLEYLKKCGFEVD